MTTKTKTKRASRVMVDINELEDAQENSMGWCPACKEFTRDSTEPDAEGYDCPECDGNTVVGVDTAMILELFEIS